MTDLQAVSLGGADLIAVRRIGKRFGSTVALQDVEKGGFWRRLIDTIRLWFA